MKRSITEKELSEGFVGVVKNTPENLRVLEKQYEEAFEVVREEYPVSNPFGYWLPSVGTVTQYRKMGVGGFFVRIFSPEAEALRLRKQQQSEMIAAVKKVISSFTGVTRMESAILAEAILDECPLVEAIYFASGGDDSEKEGAIIKSQYGEIEIDGPQEIIDWAQEAPAVSYRGYSYRKTRTFCR